MLRGRVDEQAKIDEMLACARSGSSAVMVIRGEPGIGKTALLEHAAVQAAGMTVITAVGVESESALPFAGLHLLLRDALDAIEDLPEPQRDAIDGAFGRRTHDADAPSGGQTRLLVGLATLGLLAALADQEPLLCLLDDAQWLDAESLEALQFAARRLGSDGIAMIFAARTEASGLLAGLPYFTLDRLDSADAAAVLDDRFAELSPQDRYRILTEAAGNPLALLELPRTLEPSGLVTGTQPLSDRLRDAFVGQYKRVSDAARTALLVAAAEGTGDIEAVISAAQRLGVETADLVEADRTGLVRVSGGRVVFRHPLVRAAILESADFIAARDAHAALAETLTDPRDADRRAHHLAETAIGPDEEIATELERTAERAGSRHGYAAAAAAYERAAQLSAAEPARARRYAQAAIVAAEAGQIDRAGELAERARAELDDWRLASDLDQIRAEVKAAGGTPREAHRLLLAGAAEVADHDRARAVRLLAEAANLAWHVGDPQLAAEAADRLAATELDARHRARPVVDVVVWLMTVAADRTPPDTRQVQDMLAAARLAATEVPALELVTAGASMVSGDDREAHDACARLVAEARARGQYSVLIPALTYMGQTQMFTGRHREAVVTVTEARELAEDLGQTQWLTLINGVLAYLAGLRGDEDACRQFGDASTASATANLQTVYSSWAEWARGIADLGAGRAEAALVRLEALGESAARRQVGPSRSMADRIEAAVRVGQPERAADTLRAMELWSATVCPPYAALARRCRAIMSTDDVAEAHFVAALTLHDAQQQPFERARTELLYGEWLRRMRRKTDARVRLENALLTFERLGAKPWAERARTEIRASGGPSPDVAAPDVLAALTPQEARIVQLAARGLSNKDIAAQLFLSPRTVGFHLYKAYPKLGVLSRAELAGLLPSE